MKLTFYREGKKQTVSLKLGKTSLADASETEHGAPGAMRNFQFQFGGVDGQPPGLDGQPPGFHDFLGRDHLDKDKMNVEIKRTVQQTINAIEDGVRRADGNRKSPASLSLHRELETLARGGVDVDQDATIVLRTRNNSNRTTVHTDESGSYVIAAGAKTHLTARDKQGKLLFDGDIDTAAEREKVPKEVWKKVAPLLEEMTAPNGAKPKPEGRFRERHEFLKQNFS